MDSHEFTPGPWYIKPSEEIPSPYRGVTSSTRITILDAQDGQYKPRHVIAQVARGNGRGDANAALIAAAPELYKELENYLTNTVQNSLTNMMQKLQKNCSKQAKILITAKF